MSLKLDYNRVPHHPRGELRSKRKLQSPLAITKAWVTRLFDDLIRAGL